MASDKRIRYEELRNFIDMLHRQLNNYAFELAPGWWPSVEKAYNELKQAREQDATPGNGSRRITKEAGDDNA